MAPLHGRFSHLCPRSLYGHIHVYCTYSYIGQVGWREGEGVGGEWELGGVKGEYIHNQGGEGGTCNLGKQILARSLTKENISGP